MGIVRTEKTSNYSVICNEVFKRDDMSARAKGLFAYFMTLPDDWKVHISEIQQHFTEGRDALRAAFKELDEAGYVERIPIRTEDGRLNGQDFLIHETVSLTNRVTGNPSDGESDTTKYLSLPKTKNTKQKSREADLRDNQQPSLSEKDSALASAMFERAWVLYGRTGSKKTAARYWKKLSVEDRIGVLKAIPTYLKVVAAGRRKKDFQGWINPENEMWNQDWASSLKEWTKDDVKEPARMVVV